MTQVVMTLFSHVSALTFLICYFTSLISFTCCHCQTLFFFFFGFTISFPKPAEGIFTEFSHLCCLGLLGRGSRVRSARGLNSTRLFLTSLEAESPRTKCHQIGLFRGHSLPACSHHLPSVHTCKSLNVFPQNLHDKTLILDVKIVLESETFWR